VLQVRTALGGFFDFCNSTRGAVHHHKLHLKFGFFCFLKLLKASEQLSHNSIWTLQTTDTAYNDLSEILINALSLNVSDGLLFFLKSLFRYLPNLKAFDGNNSTIPIIRLFAGFHSR